MKQCSKCKKEKENFGKDKHKADGLTSQCRDCINEYYELNKQDPCFIKNRRIISKKSIKKARDKDRPKYRKYENEYRLNRYHSDEEYRNRTIRRASVFRTNLRRKNPQTRAIDNCRRRVSNFLKGKTKYSKSIGCSAEELRAYLEAKFQPGMNWDNYGQWHVDHIYPLSLAYKKGPIEFEKACHYTNLQPLWAADNIKKGNKLQS